MTSFSVRLANCLVGAAIVVAFAVMPATTFLYLDRGMDLKDSGFHYAAIAGLGDITAMTTQFPVVWRLIAPEMGIAVSRLTIFALVLVAAAGAALALISSLPTGMMRAPGRLVWMWAITGAMFIFFFWWSPEPYYNSLSLIIVLALVALFPGLARRLDSGGTGGPALVLLAGGLVAALAYCRQPLALGVMVLASVAIGAISGRKRDLPLRAGLPFVAGIGLFVLVAHVLVEPVPQTLSRLLGGLERRAAFDRDATVLSNLLAAPGDLATMAGAYWPAMVVAAAGIWFWAGERETTSSRRTALVFCAGVIAAVAFSWIGHKQLKFTPIDRYAIAYFVLAATLSIVVPFSVHAVVATRRAGGIWRVAATAVWLCALPFAFAAGSADALIPQTLLSSGFFIAACLVVLAFLTRNGGLWRAFPFVVMLAMPLFAATHYMVTRPYGLLTPLPQQTVSTPLRGGAETLFVDAKLSRFLNETGVAYDAVPRDGRAPVLIDLTGNLPFLVYHLGMRPIGSAWIKANGKPETVGYFESMLRRLDPEDRRRAWVVMAPGDQYSFAAETLNAIDRDLATDYEMVLETSSIRIPDPKGFDYPIRILRPRAEAVDG